MEQRNSLEDLLRSQHMEINVILDIFQRYALNVLGAEGLKLFPFNYSEWLKFQTYFLPHEDFQILGFFFNDLKRRL